MIYFLHGDIPLQLKFDELVKKIRTENPNIPEKYYDLNQDDIDEIFQTLSTDSMFIPKSLIVVKRLESSKKMKQFIKALNEFNFNKKIIILIYKEELNDWGKTINEIDKTTMKNINTVAKVISARKKDEKKTLIFFVEKELNCSEYEAKKLIEMVGEDTFKIKNEIIKIKNFLNGDKFSLDKIKGVLSISEEYNIFNLVEDFLLHKKIDNLISNLKKEKTYNLFISILAEELSTLYKLKNFEKRGIISSSVSYSNFKEKIYPKIKEYFINDRFYSVKTDIRYTNPYVLFLKLRFLNLYSMEFLEKKMKDLLQIEYDFKSGLMDLELSIEKFIISFHY